jgi:outer membrane lipoprotein SlyB
MKQIITIVLISTMVAGCATSGANYRPLIDTKGVDFNKFEVDLASCQEYARTQAGAKEGAVAGALLGAAFGALLATVAGSSYDAGAAARVGGVTGAASGASSANEDQETIIKRCLQGRGYSVLK